MNGDGFEFSYLGMALILIVFYGGTLYITSRLAKRKESADGYMTAGNKVGFGVSAASMTATWIWASSMYASATSGYEYGVSGPIHYGLWGALMILFIYPFGKRIRSVAPKAHTFAEVMYVRHGRSSQLMLAGSSIAGGFISLLSNFIAGGALIAMLSPFSFAQGVIAVATGVLLYTLWSGFRASIMTDFVQVLAMLGAVAIIVPFLFFVAGFPELFETGASNLTPQQQNFFSSEAFMLQGAPYVCAVLAYAIGNQTIAQRLFAVREDLIKRTFVTATVGYGAMVIGVGMLGVLALYMGFEPAGGDTNNLIPEMASQYLPPALLILFVLMIVGALSSTADSDLSALSALTMTDIYGRNVAGRARANPQTMLLIGRLTMVIATAAAVVVAALRLDILDLLVFIGGLWGALVFPVLASFYWKKVTNAAFTTAVIVGLVFFIPLRFDWLPLDNAFGWMIEILAVIGIGVVLGLMAFAFFGLRVAKIVGVVSILATAPFALGELAEYATLTAALVSYSVSTMVCYFMSVRSKQNFDFDIIKQRTGDFDSVEEKQETQEPTFPPAKSNKYE